MRDVTEYIHRLSAWHVSNQQPLLGCWRINLSNPEHQFRRKFERSSIQEKQCYCNEGL